MFKVGDRVYDKAINANGYVVDTRTGLRPVKVQYFWAMFSKFTMGWPERTRSQWHTETPDKVRWADEEELVSTPMPDSITNTVGMFGKRILNKRIRLIAEIERYRYGDFCDIVIRYGKRPDGYRTEGLVKLILNHNLTINKWDQCCLLGDLAPAVEAYPDDSMEGQDWIVKPMYSVGGKGIENWNGYNHEGKYLQRRINKTREFRAHVYLWAKDQVPLIQEKIIDDRSQLCWNMKQGGKFHYMHEPAIGKENLDADLVQGIKDISTRALKKLKYDMGGVDLCMDEDGKLWILEVNSYWGQREMTLASTKMTFNELRHIDIDSYVRDRWVCGDTVDDRLEHPCTFSSPYDCIV
jgi:hypothetical protein